MGIGVSSGENRASEAAKKAVSSPLLEVSVDGAKGVLMNITGGSNLSLYEVQEAADIVASASDEEVNMIFGSVINDNLKDEIIVTVIATGFNEEQLQPRTPRGSGLNSSVCNRFNNRLQRLQSVMHAVKTNAAMSSAVKNSRLTITKNHKDKKKITTMHWTSRRFYVIVKRDVNPNSCRLGSCFF